MIKKTKKQGKHLLWFGAKNKQGYGRMLYRGKLWLPHRLRYKLFIGPLIEGKVIDHMCNLPACLALDCLRQKTQRENILRSESPCAKNARKTYCKRGHLLVPANLDKRPVGERACSKCRRLRRQKIFSHKEEIID